MSPSQSSPDWFITHPTSFMGQGKLEGPSQTDYCLWWAMVTNSRGLLTANQKWPLASRQGFGSRELCYYYYHKKWARCKTCIAVSFLFTSLVGHCQVQLICLSGLRYGLLLDHPGLSELVSTLRLTDSILVQKTDVMPGTGGVEGSSSELIYLLK